MKNRPAVLIAFLIVFVVPAAAQAEKQLSRKEELNVSSDQVGVMILGKKIKLMMRDGTYVEGIPTQVSANTLTIKVHKSEPKGRIVGHSAVLPTQEIAVVYMKKSGSVAVPIILGILGGFGGSMAAAAAALYSDMHPGAGGVLVIGSTVAGAVGGAYLGKAAAQKTVTINVISGASRVRP